MKLVGNHKTVIQKIAQVKHLQLDTSKHIFITEFFKEFSAEEIITPY